MAPTDAQTPNSTATDPDALAAEVARRLGAEDDQAVRALLLAWWHWAGIVTGKGEVVDSTAFLDQREAEGLLELPRPQAERAIEIELALLHGMGSARRTPRPQRGPHRQRWQIGSRTATALTVAVLAIVVAAGVLLGEAVPHIDVPGGGPEAAVDPYRAWIGLLIGAVALAGALVAMRLRPSIARALRLPALGLAGLVALCVGLLGDALWLEIAGGALFAAAGIAAWMRLR